MRRSMGPWLALPAVMLLAGSMSVASGWISRDLAGRDTMVFSSVTQPHHRAEPAIVGIMDLSQDEKELVDGGPLTLDDANDSLRPTTIIGGWALPWGFYHGDPDIGDHFPVGAGPKDPWVHKEWRGLPWEQASPSGHAELDGLDSPAASEKAPIISSDVTPPRGSIYVDHFTVSAVVPTPEPTIGLGLVGLAWLAFRRI